MLLFTTAFLSGAFAGELIPEPESFGLLHMWTTVYDMDENEIADPAGYGDPEDDIGFKLRRARLGIKGKSGLVSYRVSVGMSAPFDSTFNRGSEEIDLVDAYFRWKAVPNLWLTAGVQKIPVSREQIMSSADLVLAERAVSSVWLVPNREVGLLADYTADLGGSKINAQVGVFNGNGSLVGDNNTGKMVAGRIEYFMGKGIYKTYSKDKGFMLAVAVDGFLNSDIATQEVGYGADFLMRAANISLLGEFRMKQLDPTGTELDTPLVFAQTQQMGFLAQIGYSIGAFEPAIRYSSFDDNMENENAGDGTALSVGCTWHSKKDKVRIGGGYEMRLEKESYVVANDTARLWMMLRY